jgi:hypothetical protein
MEVVKNLMASSSSSSASSDSRAKRGQLTMLDTARAVYKDRGLIGFYRGVQFSAGGSCTEKFIYFYAYNFLRRLAAQLAGKRSADDLSVGASLAVGALAEWFHLPITLPMETLLVQVMRERKGRGPVQIVRETVRKDGLWSYYKALPAFVVLCLKPAIQYAIFEKLKAALLKGRRGAQTSLTALEAFCLGAVARMVSTVATFPYQRAKFIKQGDPSSNRTIGETVVHIINTQGVRGLFTGLQPDLQRGVLSSALMLMTKERLQARIKGALGNRSQPLAAAAVKRLEARGRTSAS